MKKPGTFLFDNSNRFEHLPHAPIVEAVIHWSARSETNTKPRELEKQLKEKLLDYPTVIKRRQISFKSQISDEGIQSEVKDDHWHGFRFESENKKYIAQFTRDGFGFSRIAPYETWEIFEKEALRLWKVYEKLAEPSRIERMGVRFINRITIDAPGQLNEYLTVPLRSPEELKLPIYEFMHDNLFDIPGHNYRLKIIQALQNPTSSQDSVLNYILDIDVFTTKDVSLDDEMIKSRLSEMRNIKNSAFFNYFTKKAIDSFKE